MICLKMHVVKGGSASVFMNRCGKMDIPTAVKQYSHTNAMYREFDKVLINMEKWDRRRGGIGDCMVNCL